MHDHIQELTALMRRNGLDEVVIKTFTSQYKKVQSGETGIIPEDTIHVPRNSNLINLSDLRDNSGSMLNKLLVLKLNGGLGTSMGLSKAKSLLTVKQDLTFLDIIALQMLELRKISGKHTPLMFMNSFNTQSETLQKLSAYNELQLMTCPWIFCRTSFLKSNKQIFPP